jgi:predicted ATPase
MVAEPVRRLCLLAASCVPLIVIVDDVQRADTATVAVLRRASSAAETAGVVLVLGVRDDEVGGDEPVRHFVAECVARGAHLLVMAPLASEEVAGLLADAGMEATQRLTASVVATTGGNAFFVTATLRHLLESGPAAVSQVPPTARTVVRSRVDRLGHRARQLLSAVSILEGPFPFDLAVTLAGLDEGDALDALDAALSSHLLVSAPGGDHYRFTHALLAAAVAEEVNPSRRLRLHRHAAEAMAARLGARWRLLTETRWRGTTTPAGTLPVRTQGRCGRWLRRPGPSELERRTDRRCSSASPST